MNIYKVSQDINNDYDTYDSFVCYAENEEEAKEIFPRNGKSFIEMISQDLDEKYYVDRLWTSDKSKIEVEFLGTAKDGSKKGVILASFNAG